MPASTPKKDPKKPVRLLLIDDHGMCRLGFGELIEKRLRMKVVGSVETLEEAESCLEHESPDMIVLDLSMPMMDGLSLLARLREQGYQQPAVILTMSDSQEDLAAAIRAEVRGYLLKYMDPDDVLEGVRRAACGELVIAPEMASKLTRLLQPKEALEANNPGKLTEREREVLRHLAAGESNKTIARALHISHDTVKLHVRHILAKLGLSSRVEAAVFAVEHGEHRVGTGR